MSGIKNKAVSEMILKRKLIRKNYQKDDDDVSSNPMIEKNLKRTNKNEDLEDNKISIKKSKINSMGSDDVSKNQFGGDFLSIYLAERDKKKKKKKNKKFENKET